MLLLWRSNSLLVAAAQARLPRPPSTLSRRLLLQLRRLQLQLQPRLRQRLPTPRWMSRRSPSHKSTRRRRSILRSRSAARRRSSPSLPRRKATRSTRRTSSTKPSRPTIAPSNSTRARCPSSPTVLVRVLLRVARHLTRSLARSNAMPRSSLPSRVSCLFSCQLPDRQVRGMHQGLRGGDPRWSRAPSLVRPDRQGSCAHRQCILQARQSRGRARRLPQVTN